MGRRARRARPRAYISYYPDLAVPGAADDGRRVRRAGASAAGVRRLVLLSGRGEDEAQQAEQRAARTSGADWTIVRCSWFNQNFSESFFLEPAARAGELALPAGDVREPFVDVDDIADVAVAALTEDGHAGELYELTGPRLLRFAEAVAEIAAAAGREIALRAGHAARSSRPGWREPGVPADVTAAARVPVRRGARRPQRAR